MHFAIWSPNICVWCSTERHTKTHHAKWNQGCVCAHDKAWSFIGYIIPSCWIKQNRFSLITVFLHLLVGLFVFVLWINQSTHAAIPRSFGFWSVEELLIFPDFHSFWKCVARAANNKRATALVNVCCAYHNREISYNCVCVNIFYFIAADLSECLPIQIVV